MSRVVPRILVLQPELLEAWPQVRARRAADPGYVGADLIVQLDAAWGRAFDAAEIIRVSRELARRDARGRPCMCGSWGCLPLWAALAFDVGLDAELYATDVGWTFAYCYICRKANIPEADMDGQRGEACTICGGDGLAPTWVTNMINCPEMSLGQVREAGMWFPVPCSGCGGWGRMWPGEDANGVSDQGASVAPAVVAVASPPVLQREGDGWRAFFGGRETYLADRVGIRHLALLLERPGQAVDAMQLMAVGAPAVEGDAAQAAAAGLSVTLGGDAGEVIDERARRAYRDRLGALELELRVARSDRDPGRIERLEAERSALVDEIKRGIGLHGSRRARSDMERARKAVSKAIRSAIEHIGKQLPELGDHLRAAVRLGLDVQYQPASPPLPSK